jgi:tetratricopeptide (TPR) repeat protein
MAEAQRELEAVLRVAPENIAARRELGEIYRRDGRLPEALEQLRSALALAPQDAELAASVEALARSAPPAKAGPERPPEPPAFQITTTSLETFPHVEAFPSVEDLPPVEAFTPPLEGSSDEPSGGGVKGARLLARLEGWLARIDADRQRRDAADTRG